MAIAVRLLGGAALAAAAWTGIAGEAATSPFAFFEPAVPIAPADRARLETGHAVVRVLPGRGRELAIFAAVRVDAGPERLIEWGRRVETMPRGRYVPVLSRFSDPPRLDDVESLTLGEDDLEDIRRCRPGDCGLKLSAPEIRALRQNIASSADWRSSAQRGFRQAIVSRALAYRAYGDAGALPYDDSDEPVAPQEEFTVLVQRLGFLQLQLPWFADYLEAYPRLDHPDVVDSSLYWATETLGVKPITSVTHISIVRGTGPHVPGALVVSKQVFATHYKDASLAVTAVIGSADSGYFLVYVHRSHVDVLTGALGGLVRRIVERRVRDEAPDVLFALRRRLESLEHGR
jgi:hypothetical protein